MRIATRGGEGYGYSVESITIDLCRQSHFYNDVCVYVSLFAFCVESMNELASLTQQLCTSIMNRDIPIPEFPLHPYSEEQLQVGIVTILHVLTSVVFLVVESNEHYNYVLSEVIPNAMSHKCQECSLQLFSIVIIVYLLPDLR